MGFRIVLSIVLAISIFSPPMSGALTTFGKSPQNPPPPPAPTITASSARECKTNSDCAAIQNTTCMSDQRDGKTRCLCGDYSPPKNGVCNNKFKALHATCNSDIECLENAQCVRQNGTSGRRCYCREGYFEDFPFYCNGCSSIFTLYTTTLLAASLMLGFSCI